MARAAASASDSTRTRRRRLLTIAVALLGAAAIAAFVLLPDGTPPPSAERCGDVAREGALPADDAREWIDLCVRLNQVQVLGTHNSYRVQPTPEMLGLLTAFSPDLARSLEYTHRPIDEQLDRGIRQLELDVFADPDGGRYADPAGQRLAPGPAVDPDGALQRPGFKVLHVQDVDFRSRCLTLVACLGTVKEWSKGHPGHVPLLVLIEVKDAPIPDPGVGFVVPLPTEAAHLDALDEEVRSVFGPDHLLTPDDIRGRRATLHEAVTADGWPALGQVRGKVMVALDNTGSVRDLYLSRRPTLEGRAMFASGEPPEPWAAFVKLNDPLTERARIEELVRLGFVVRTRADGETEQGRTGDTAQREAALASGAQWVSTDYPDPSPFGTGYVVRLPGGGAARCNPVMTWAPCATDLLE